MAMIKMMNMAKGTARGNKLIIKQDGYPGIRKIKNAHHRGNH